MGVFVLEKCLDFCQELVMSNHKFSFNFSIGKDNFNLENSELVNSSWKKMKSPSQFRREAKRRETTQEVTEKVSAKSLYDNHNFKCDLCGLSFITEKGLNIYMFLLF